MKYSSSILILVDSEMYLLSSKELNCDRSILKGNFSIARSNSLSNSSAFFIYSSSVALFLAAVISAEGINVLCCGKGFKGGEIFGCLNGSSNGFMTWG